MGMGRIVTIRDLRGGGLPGVHAGHTSFLLLLYHLFRSCILYQSRCLCPLARRWLSQWSSLLRPRQLASRAAVCAHTRRCAMLARTISRKTRRSVCLLLLTGIATLGSDQGRSPTQSSHQPLGRTQWTRSHLARQQAPTAWAISPCAKTTAGEAAVEEGLSAWMVTQQIARQQQAARRRGVVFPPLIPGPWGSDGLE
jgi:hypothetical protein